MFAILVKSILNKFCLWQMRNDDLCITVVDFIVLCSVCSKRFQLMSLNIIIQVPPLPLTHCKAPNTKML